MQQEIHQRILKVGADCFSQNGYAGTSIKDICQVANVAPATLFKSGGTRVEGSAICRSNIYGSLLGFVLTQQVVPGVVRPVDSSEKSARQVTAILIHGVLFNQTLD